MKKLTLGMMLAALFGLSGCNTLHDEIISCETGLRNHVLAQNSWNHWSWCYDELDHPYHFARGFKAGYREVLDGGAGCQPTLPPRCYWKPIYQTPEGHCKVNAWFDGFAHGALAAKQDGFGNFSEIPISPTARMNFAAAQAPPPQHIYRNVGHTDGVVIDESTGHITARPLMPVPEAPLVSGDGSSAVLPNNSGSGTRSVIRPYEE